MSDYIATLEAQNEELKQKLAAAEERLAGATYGEWVPVNNGKIEPETYHYKVGEIHLATVHILHNLGKKWAGYVNFANNGNLYQYESLQVAMKETERQLFILIAHEFKESGKQRRYTSDGRTWQ